MQATCHKVGKSTLMDVGDLPKKWSGQLEWHVGIAKRNANLFLLPPHWHLLRPFKVACLTHFCGILRELFKAKQQTDPSALPIVFNNQLKLEAPKKKSECHANQFKRFTNRLGCQKHKISLSLPNSEECSSSFCQCHD